MINLPTYLNWNLVYRASVDGFSANSFHSKCGSIRNTLTIIKTTNSFTFGGFTSSDWSTNGNMNSIYKYDANAFIFSLVNNYNISVRMNATQPQNAILASYYNGPTFGNSNDIYIADDSNASINSFSNLGYGFKLPSFILNSSNSTNSTFNSSTTGVFSNNTASSFLAGSYNFMTYEIEIYSTNRKFLHF